MQRNIVNINYNEITIIQMYLIIMFLYSFIKFNIIKIGLTGWNMTKLQDLSSLKCLKTALITITIKISEIKHSANVCQLRSHDQLLKVVSIHTVLCYTVLNIWLQISKKKIFVSKIYPWKHGGNLICREIYN